MLRDNVSFKELQMCLEAMDKAEKQATAVYRWVALVDTLFASFTALYDSRVKFRVRSK
jgi:hypothetical protein